MQLPWDEHFREIVIPAWQAYLQAEQRLTGAFAADDAGKIEKAKYDALREGGAAVFYVHHFGEVVLRARPHWLPPELTAPAEVSGWLSSYCTMLRSDERTNDVSLLGDVADALKHAILTRRLDSREVSANEAVLVAGREYGAHRYGEGKFGGLDEVWVLANSGARALSCILQNVIDAWRRVAGIELPAIGLP
jgi:hypothetical protein